MFYVVLFIANIFLSSGIHALSEGDYCDYNGAAGVCTKLFNCETAKKQIAENKRHLVIRCGFEGLESIVCCMDKPVMVVPLATTTKRVPVSSTTMYVPPTYDYVDVNNRHGKDECSPISPELTAPKTGQKAWDKCLEYQEKLIYPCEDPVILQGGKIRGHYCTHLADKLIIGGNDTEPYEFSHMVLLGYGPSQGSVEWRCGGSLISERFVLTAGHCIADRELGNVTFVAVGVYRRSEADNPSAIYAVKRIIKNPQYNSPSKFHDIALLELEKDVPLSATLVPACLHVPSDPLDDSKVLATGWGLTLNKGSASEKLQKVVLKKFTTWECSIKFPSDRLMKGGFDDRSQLCYGDKGESKDTCQGDSGGPIQISSPRINCMYMIVGVTSFGRACGFIGDPGIYTKVSNYIPWIESVVWP